MEKIKREPLWVVLLSYALRITRLVLRVEARYIDKDDGKAVILTINDKG